MTDRLAFEARLGDALLVYAERADREFDAWAVTQRAVTAPRGVAATLGAAIRERLGIDPRRLVIVVTLLLLVAAALAAFASGLRPTEVDQPVFTPTASTRVSASALPGGLFRTGLLAYADPDRGIVVANPDGTNERVIWWSPGSVSDAVWSPDGTMIAFAHVEPEVEWSADVHTTPGSEFPVSVRVSPASQFIVIRPDGTEVWRHDLDPEIQTVSSDSGPAQVMAAVHPEPAVWAPDGSAIATIRRPSFDDPGPRTIQIYPLDGGPVQELATGGDVVAWSPRDDSFVAYPPTGKLSPDGYQQVVGGGLYRSLGGGQWEHLSDLSLDRLGGTVGPVDWSNDGRRLAFWTAIDGGPLELSTIQLDGSGPTVIGAYDVGPMPSTWSFSGPPSLCWSPDDRWIGIPTLPFADPLHHLLVVDVISGAEIGEVPYQQSRWWARCDPWQRLQP